MQYIRQSIEANYSRETLKANVSGYSLNNLLITVLFPPPDGPDTTMGRNVIADEAATADNITNNVSTLYTKCFSCGRSLKFSPTQRAGNYCSW